MEEKSKLIVFWIPNVKCGLALPNLFTLNRKSQSILRCGTRIRNESGFKTQIPQSNRQIRILARMNISKPFEASNAFQTIPY
jgi:hypothetical protein